MWSNDRFSITTITMWSIPECAGFGNLVGAVSAARASGCALTAAAAALPRNARRESGCSQRLMAARVSLTGILWGMARNDLLGRLADISEEAVQRLSDAPGGERLMNTLNSMRDRVDELQRRVRGLEDLEKRLEALERKVDKLAKGDGSASSSTGSSKTTSTKSSGASSAKKP